MLVFMIMMRLVVGISLLGSVSVLAQPAAVPPPVTQAGADCVRPQYASDRLVCGDPELRAVDAEVVALAAQLSAPAGSMPWEDQFAWLRRRSRCAFQADHRGCLVAAYADRRAVLTASKGSADQPISCTGAWKSRLLKIGMAADAAVITENGRLAAIATPARAGWQPWLAFAKSGTRLTLKPQAAPVIRCRLL